MYIPEGLIIGAIIGWVMWWGFSTFDEWSSDRREMKEIDRHNKEFNKHHHYNERLQRWVRNSDGAALYEYGYGPPKKSEDQK
jgi:nitrogen fixation-related uncharacterized protein